MALSAIEATASGVVLATSDEDEEMEGASLELRMRKVLLDSLFGEKGEEEKADGPKVRHAQADSVDLSAEAIELYQRDSGRISVRMEDGARLDILYEREASLRIETVRQEVEEAEPLVIDLDGNGLDLTDVRKGEGVRFDITGDGRKETVSWVRPSDGLLVYDRNGNGVIDSGKELFGDQYGARNGFEELAKFDEDGNGVIDRNDAIYDKLKVWQDLNQNGTSESYEMKSLKEHGISSIDLRADDTQERIAGNRIEGYSTYQSTTGSGKVGEVFLNYFA